ncbi:MAG: hypothetical protein KC619_02940 [Myxococcales bacterium]|nr:hypothetical protein [Myxococcales bacterium]
MRYSLFDRLRAWGELLSRREDLELFHDFRSVPHEEAVRLGVPVDLAEPFPSDVRDFAREADELSFEYRVKGTYEGGSLFLSLARWESTDELVVDGRRVADTMYTLEADRLGTGLKAYLVMADPPYVLWDFATLARFESLTDYLTAGAKRAFNSSPCWQKQPGAQPHLCRLSEAADTPPSALRRGLVARGAAPAMADDLLEWLGADVRFLLPAPRTA